MYGTYNMYQTYRLFHQKILFNDDSLLNVPTLRSYVVSGLTHHDSRLAFGTGDIRSICKLDVQQDSTYSMLGMDSHADISCAGRDAHILTQSEGKSCTVRPFNDSYDPMTGINIVDALVKYQSIDGDEYILEINQCLDFTDTMVHSILCTNQARHIGIIINDVPKVCDSSSTQDLRSRDGKYILPLEMNGPIPFLPISKPSENDIEGLPRLKLTANDIEWDPQNIFNSMNTGGYKYLEEDFEIAHTIQGVSTLEKIAHTHSQRISSISHMHNGKFKAEDLANLWGIGVKAANKTLRATTQLSTRQISGRIHKRVRTRMHQRRYRQLWGHLSRFSSDTFKSKVKSLRGNNYFQLFTNNAAFTKVYPMKGKGESHLALHKFLHEIGIPSELHTDNAGELIHGEWNSLCQQHKIYRTYTEPHSPWQNMAERAGGIIKARAKDMMRRTNTPVILWDYCIEYNADLRCLTATNIFDLNGRTPFETVLGFTPDISELVEFGWYQWVWYHDPVHPERDNLGRWLGPAHNIGQGLAYYILNSNAEVIVRSTVSTIIDDNICPTDLRIRQKEFTDRVESLIGNYQHAVIQKSDQKPDEMVDIYSDLFELTLGDNDELQVQTFGYDPNEVTKPDAEEIKMYDAPNSEFGDKWINANVPISYNGEIVQGTVKRRKRDGDSGMLLGKAHQNPTLDTRVYEVEMPDGTYADYHANNLIENIFNNVDDNGHSPLLLNEIIDHRSGDDAVPIEDGWYRTPEGMKKRVITTKGWDLKIQWRDGSSNWIPLKDIKEANPIEVAEYAVRAHISNEPAFAWWVNSTLKRRNKVIKQVHHRLAKKTHKFGIKVPNSVEEALRLDKDNGNDLWKKAIDKELGNVRIAFKLLEEGERLPGGSKEIPYHIIFDVKLDLTRKARLVAGGHRNKHVPTYTTFSTVASRDSVRLMFLIAALNDLDLLSADIGNAYLNAKCRERVHVKCGAELFGQEHKGKWAVICRALYGLKTSGASWRQHLASEIRNLGFTNTKADPDVYRRKASKKSGIAYYEYIIVYVDDIICVSHEPKRWIGTLGEIYRLRDVGTPTKFLGSNIKRWTYVNGEGHLKNCWALGSETYVKEACKVVEMQMKCHDLKYPSTRRHGANSPFSSTSYRPELNSSPFCNDELTNVYQNMVGVLRWIIELGRIDIQLETSLLSQYLAQPRQGHLSQACNIFRYLKSRYQKGHVVMDPTLWDISWSGGPDDTHPREKAIYMAELYPDATQNIPYDMPSPLGNPVNITCFVDADHAGNRVTRRSHTGILIYVNSAPIIWHSKRQNTVESSTFGSEIVAMRYATDMVEALLYKLRMFGIPIQQEARVLCDNESVVKVGVNPEARLAKKHNSIAFHRVRECVAAQMILIYHEKGESNLADILTKVLPVERRTTLLKGIMN